MQPLKFQSRIDAGQKIAESLFGLKLDLFGESGNQDIVILAVPRGGIIIRDVVASELAARLDVVVSRKIGAPNNPELAIGAVMPDGDYFLNKEIVDLLNISQEYIDIQASIQLKEIDRRLLSYRGSKEYDNEFEDKIVVFFNAEQAIKEIESLFAAQWKNGMISHIVFDKTKKTYFPSAKFYDIARSENSPKILQLLD